MPTAKGFTGQRADVTTGLDYYGARYYDAQAGQFASADSVADGLSPYAYVASNPETATDPTGHLIRAGDGQGGGDAGNGCQNGDEHCGGGCYSSCCGNQCTNPRVVCQGDPDIKACYGYEAWEKRQEDKRNDALAPKKNRAIALIVAGTIIIALSDLVLAFTGNTGERLLAFLDFAITISSLATYYANPFWIRMAGIANGVASVIRGAIAAYDSLGIFAQGAISAAVTIAQAFTGGEVLTGLKVTLNLLKPVVGAIANYAGAYGHQLLSEGLGEYADYTAQANTSIQDWCAQDGSGICEPEPTSV